MRKGGAHVGFDARRLDSPPDFSSGCAQACHGYQSHVSPPNQISGRAQKCQPTHPGDSPPSLSAEGALLAGVPHVYASPPPLTNDLADDGAQLSDSPLSRPSPIIREIIQLWRMRQRWHRAEKSLILQGKAICRAWTGGDKGKASDLFDEALAGNHSDPVLAVALMPFIASIEKFAPERKAIEKRLRKLAKQTPWWSWVEQVKGFGDLNLAAIVGEAGDIASYRNPSCLWMRFGLGVIDGGRQRKVADAKEALRHGYAPHRRCVAYLLGDTIIKKTSPYRQVYLDRKVIEAERTKTKAHAHNRAARYMVKMILKDLWIEAKRIEQAPVEAP
jgi:hypothetical protein